MRGCGGNPTHPGASLVIFDELRNSKILGSPRLHEFYKTCIFWYKFSVQNFKKLPGATPPRLLFFRKGHHSRTKKHREKLSEKLSDKLSSMRILIISVLLPHLKTHVRMLIWFSRKRMLACWHLIFHSRSCWSGSLKNECWHVDISFFTRSHADLALSKTNVGMLASHFSLALMLIWLSRKRMLALSKTNAGQASLWFVCFQCKFSSP